MNMSNYYSMHTFPTLLHSILCSYDIPHQITMVSKTLLSNELEAASSEVPTALLRGARWRIWLRHCATSRNVAGSIPDGVIGIFH